LVIPGFEFRASNLLGRLSTTCAMPPVWDIPYKLSFFFFPVLGLELRAFTLCHSTNPIFVKGFSR
jgi:hypothetical protein